SRSGSTAHFFLHIDIDLNEAPFPGQFRFLRPCPLQPAIFFLAAAFAQSGRARVGEDFHAAVAHYRLRHDAQFQLGSIAGGISLKPDQRERRQREYRQSDEHFDQREAALPLHGARPASPSPAESFTSRIGLISMLRPISSWLRRSASWSPARPVLSRLMSIGPVSPVSALTPSDHFVVRNGLSSITVQQPL